MTDRLETGPLNPDGDWPGIFIRGDDALSYATALRRAVERLSTIDDARLDGAKLAELVDLLGSCRVKQS